ncbi:hypothetical protein LOK49_LG08G02689 [Camellia lanceoleosa]|uniref:Uncharacterized protein n=1 Tax=Camellia lanceoleosa TaxID=1840588 RepID=A0ACC0GR28_9ERIC|nr:hypothetical protein LOK49_LG08G02689 [Camellia lanceoleosa]
MGLWDSLLNCLCRSMLISSPITGTSSGSVVTGLKMELGASASTSGSSMKVNNILNLSVGTVMTCALAECGVVCLVFA